MSLKFGILGMLAEEDLHGYEIKSRFETMLGGTWEVNIGQIYSTLQRLERDLLIETIGERGDRGKLAYHLTETGRNELEHWLHQPIEAPQEIHDEFFVKLLLLNRLAKDKIGNLITQQRRVHLQQLRDLTAMERQARVDGHPVLSLLIRNAILHAEADLKWIDVYLEENSDSHAP
jgi:DNA-binding PadR family transcriptional regulator